MIASHAKLRKVRKFNKFKERKLKSYIDNLIRRNENCETILRVYWLYRKRGIGLPKHQSSAASWAGVLGAKPSRKTLFNISVLETFLESTDSNEPEGDSPETERLIAVKWRKRGVNDQTRKWQYNFTLYWQFYNSDQYQVPPMFRWSICTMPVCRLSTILKDVPYRIQSRVLSTHRFNNRSITKATNFRFQTGPSIILVNRRQKSSCWRTVAYSRTENRVTVKFFPRMHQTRGAT